ncbi:MAG: nicotinate-nucleotide--dimethylbenzimidazole phosphoribosyltransferase [Rhizobiaceae bacterium]|nr:nicotinate-nucleotide--dimethylbenzimidazole phosphoribosyltransferase [Rhizobiaceae bacterium]
MRSRKRETTDVISALPFDDFRSLMRRLPPADERAGDGVRALLGRLDKPAGSLGRLEDIAAWLATWSGRVPPSVNRPLMAVFAGTHGVLARGVSAHGPDWTARRVELCAAGGAAISQLCLASDIGLKVFDLALHLPTADMTAEAALDERACMATMAFGMEAISGTDLLAIGDIGAGNSTVAAAIALAMNGGTADDWVSVRQHEGAAMLSRRRHAVEDAVALHRHHLGDPLEALRRLGGREFAAIAGAIVAARMEKVPVILDGLAAFAAAQVLHALEPEALRHCLLAQLPDTPGAAGIAARLGLTPLLDLAASHGEGVSAAVAVGVVKCSAMAVAGMAATLR